jgi:hypothetical protein
MWYSVRITVHYGDGVHSITVSQKTFAEIRGGKEITLQGDGFSRLRKVLLRIIGSSIATLLGQ